MDSQSSLLTIAEVATLLKVSRKTVYRWLRDGKILGAIRIGERGSWRIPACMVTPSARVIKR